MAYVHDRRMVVMSPGNWPTLDQFEEFLPDDATLVGPEFYPPDHLKGDPHPGRVPEFDARGRHVGWRRDVEWGEGALK